MQSLKIDQFRNNRPQLETVGKNTEFVGFIPQSLVLRSIVLDRILIDCNWSVHQERSTDWSFGHDKDH